MAGSSCKSGLNINTPLCGSQRAGSQWSPHGGVKYDVSCFSIRPLQDPPALPHCAGRLLVRQKLSARGCKAPGHHTASFLRCARIRACNSSTDGGAAPVSSDAEQPRLTSTAEQKQANMTKRLEAARSKATDYQQNTNVASGLGQIRNQSEVESSMSDLDSDDDDDDENSSGGGRGYGVVGLLLNQKPKKESFYKNAKREVAKPGVLPDIEIVRGKKVVSERRPLKDD